MGHLAGSGAEVYGSRLPPSHHQALTAIQRCRTQALGTAASHGHAGDSHEVFPLSCGHRCCPQCQHETGETWLERQRAKLPPVDYDLITYYRLRANPPDSSNHKDNSGFASLTVLAERSPLVTYRAFRLAAFPGQRIAPPWTDSRKPGLPGLPAAGAAVGFVS